MIFLKIIYGEICIIFGRELHIVMYDNRGP